MGVTSLKKDKEKKKAKAKQEKAEKMAERKLNNNKGKSLDDMMVYLDENGNFTDTPPDPSKKIEIDASEISLDNKREPEVVEEKKGIVTFFNESKGYGFITDMKTKANIFVHINQLLEPIKENNVVIYDVERTPRGLSAVRVRKDK
jgi:cold shock CspA family protein